MLLTRNIFVGIAIGIAGLLTSCGGSDINLEVVLSSNETINPLKKISTDMQLGVSSGIFFVLDELKATPVSIDDLLTSGDTYSEPDLTTGIGAEPLQDSFKVSTSSLHPNSFYRIKMIAKDTSGNITFIGVGDCPIKVSFKDQNKVKICFGKNDVANPPLCAGLTAFTSCPGL